MSKVIADTLQGRAAGNEAPDCPKGLTATGVVTATSFSGSGANLTGIAATDNIAAASLTVSGITTYYGDIQLQNGVGVGNSVTWDASANSLIFKDKSYAKFGDGSDLVIHHDSSNSYITNATGNLNIQAKITEDSIIAKADDAVELYFNGGKKLETTNTGAVITGIATATQFVSTAGPVARRNKIINGGMNVCQRYFGGTIQHVSATEYYITDRFMNDTGSSFDMDCDMSQRKVGPSTAGYAPAGFSHSLFTAVSGTSSPTAAQNGGISTKIEGKDVQDFEFGTSDAKPITVSFYAKSGSQNNNAQYSLMIAFTDSDTARNQQNRLFTVTSSWQRFTFTCAANGTALTKQINNTNTTGFQLFWSLMAGSSDLISERTTWATDAGLKGVTGQDNFGDHADNEFWLTGVQVEIGEVATPFEHRSYVDELDRCRRYFQVTYGGGCGQGVGGSTNAINRAQFNVSPELRANPTVAFSVFHGGNNIYTYDGTNTAQYNGISQSYGNTHTIEWETTNSELHSGSTGAGNPVIAYINGSAGGISISAEL